MITYTGYKLKVIFIIFLFLGYHVVAYAEMGRDREFAILDLQKTIPHRLFFIIILAQRLFQI